MSERLKQLERVAEGAQAEIFRGELVGERGTFRKVAIKRLRECHRSDPRAVDLFAHEARIALQVDHPNLARAIELGRDDEGYYLVCEWVSGLSLEALLQHAGPAPWEAVVHVGAAVCDGLAHLHDLAAPDGTPLRAVHQDVTPANILVSVDGLIKLTDFGVASCTTGEPLAAAGTPGFAAPEQVEGGVVGVTADVYGVGRTLQAVAGELPPSVRAVLERATAVEPEQRHAGATELRRALSEASAADGATGSAEALRAWYAKGAPKEPVRQAVRLDGAVRSVLAGALQPQDGTEARPVCPPGRSVAPARPWRRRLAAVAALVALGAIVAVAWVRRLEPHTSMAEPQSTPTTAPTFAEPTRSGTANPGSQHDPKVAATAGSAAVAEPSTTPGDRIAAAPVESPKRELMSEEERSADRDVAAASGILRLNALPWAHVRVDGRPMGSTPLRAVRLRAGRHRVDLHHPPEGLTHSLDIEVKANAVQTLVVDLRRGTVDKRVE